jgi:hypothetical protein
MEKISTKEWIISSLRGLTGIAILGVLIFLPAGTFDYWQGGIRPGTHVNIQFPINP